VGSQSWQVVRRTWEVRHPGGFGIYYNRTEEESALQTLETPPFGLSSSGAIDFGGSPEFINPFADINGGGSEANKFPYTFPTKGRRFRPRPGRRWKPLDISTFGSSFRAPYAENFQLSLERELPGRTVVRLSYIGSLARHNQVTYEGNAETAAGHAACLAGTEYSPFTGGTRAARPIAICRAITSPRIKLWGRLTRRTWALTRTRAEPAS